ncbi:tripartite ATP-independent transporter DctP family solute receptor [Chromohalobacter marismortui]|uniref:Tripartite ATP-independent transporter DctP family solute receptor n=1 Tax=Chromohalobacter marismortui TaxID=42055 RepID=A0A4R7NNN5_9GAMM|nr:MULTISPECIES: DctP family TRAP transporter solute-binding subunit [Chromohalobacter]MCI0509718.1 DctP family TRAP transporter solute-binding subunit [Chromohalobacter sp.]MCI0593319.1 DctP family TRAP transporter solute-binding subunit [Chromohalobacter sp.]TDU21940.1 tripartite ATP-independent transporter DctP family solute receptor [Chromohalobacter marismortui]
MKSMNWKTLLIGAALGIGVSAYANAAQTIRFAHVDPADWTSSKKGAAAEMFKDVVEARTDMDVKLYPAGSLGDEDELVQQAMDGTTQVVMVSGAMSKICPAAGVLSIPYMFDSAVTAWRVLDGQFGDQLAQHCLEQTGLRTLGYGETGFRNFTNDVRPIETPADMKGLKFRVQDIPLYVKMVEALGGEPTPIAWSELPTALSTGVVDGQENPVGTIYNNNLYELQDYMTLDQHIYGTDFILINERFYQSLSKADQRVLKKAGVMAGYMGRSIQQMTTAKGLKAVKEAGMNVYKPTPEEMDKFRKAAQPPVVEWLKKDLGDESVWIKKLQSAVDEVEQ